MSPVLDPEGAHLAALRRLGDFRDKRVLELGCGDGRLTVGIARDAEHVGHLLRNQVSAVPGVRSTRTTIVLGSMKESPRLPIVVSDDEEDAVLAGREP